MLCPLCKKELLESIVSNVAVHYCSACLGLWFPKNELQYAKDNRDRDLRWFDIDLWKDKTKFVISRGIKHCPSCRMPLYEIGYGESGVKVDLCNVCEGIWLDRGEFHRVIQWVTMKADYEIVHNYLKNLISETAEIFTGPESLRNEIADFLTIVKLMNYKFSAQHPGIATMISNLPK